MKIAIKKENDLIYFQKGLTDKSIKQLTNEPYNYKIIDIAEEYVDCIAEDFNNDLTFNKTKYEQRKQNALNLSRIAEIQTRLNELSQDFIQADLGAVFSDLEQRKEEFKTLHNELRVLLNKEPRIYI